MNISAPIRPLVRETFRPAPRRWLTLSLFQHCFNALPEAQSLDMRHGGIAPTAVMDALAWNVEHGYLDQRINAETEEPEYRLTDSGRRDIGA